MITGIVLDEFIVNKADAVTRGTAKVSRATNPFLELMTDKRVLVQ